MPDWCYNHATFSHEDPAMIKKLIAGYNKGKLFDTFVPMPDELRETSSPSPTNEELVKKYGDSDWYSWAVRNWGTKWDTGQYEYDNITEEEDVKEITLSFDTAWGPPIKFYDTMCNDLGFKIAASYTEEGMGFAGIYETDTGDIFVNLNFNNDSKEWINSIEHPDLKFIVQGQFEEWLIWQEENTEKV
jgi:hypothetical protein